MKGHGHTRLWRKARISLFALLAFCCLGGNAPLQAGDCNALVVEQIRTMPRGGRYAVNRTALDRLKAAMQLREGRLLLAPSDATPSFCSSATYLVFLKTLQALERRGELALSPAVWERLAVRGEADGRGVWGRWNANGPGTARFFHELGLGRNFEDFSAAKAGDFLKIFWTEEIGRRERGHSVIYLGRKTQDGVEYVGFWSSNLPEGYSAKWVPRRKIARALFSRLENPAALQNLPELPLVDSWLAGLSKTSPTLKETRSKIGL